MTVTYCAGSPRRAEALIGWSRDTVTLSRHEQRTGIIRLGTHWAFSGRQGQAQKLPETDATFANIRAKDAWADNARAYV